MKKEGITFNFKTLTPLWTGDASRKCKIVKESSIIGSLRWWYEKAIITSGEKVCSMNNACSLGYEKFIKALPSNSIESALNEQNICPVCRLFGCTGWASKFKTVLESDVKGEDISQYRIEVSSRVKDNAIRRVEGLMFTEDNPLRISFYPQKEITNQECRLLYSTIQLICDWAALGGRTAQGNGVIELISKIDDSVQAKYQKPKNSFFLKFQLTFKDEVQKLINKSLFWTGSSSPIQKECWRRAWSEYHFIPIAFHIRDAIRKLETDKNKRHNMFGKPGWGSKIFVSHGYKISSNIIEFRIWGCDISEEDINATVASIREILNKDLNMKLFTCQQNFIKNLTLIDYLKEK